MVEGPHIEHKDVGSNPLTVQVWSVGSHYLRIQMGDQRILKADSYLVKPLNKKKDIIKKIWNMDIGVHPRREALGARTITPSLLGDPQTHKEGKTLHAWVGTPPFSKSRICRYGLWLMKYKYMHMLYSLKST